LTADCVRVIGKRAGREEWVGKVRMGRVDRRKGLVRGGEWNRWEWERRGGKLVHIVPTYLL
jgi:hypothetical protein